MTGFVSDDRAAWPLSRPLTAEIVPVADPDRDAVLDAASAVEATYRVDAWVDPPFELSDAADKRGWYRSDAVLKAAAAQSSSDVVLALVGAGLYSDERGDVIGAAAQGCAAVSIAALRSDDPGPGRERDRLRTAVIGVLGAVFLGRYCGTDACPLARPASVEHLDAATDIPCKACRRALQDVLREESACPS